VECSLEECRTGGVFGRFSPNTIQSLTESGMGTIIRCPHCRQAVFVPPRCVAALIRFWHLGQLKRINLSSLLGSAGRC
jgi:hypothetical protein